MRAPEKITLSIEEADYDVYNKREREKKIVFQDTLSWMSLDQFEIQFIEK